MIGGTVSIPVLICPALCIEPNDPARGYIISTLFFVSGIVTFLQTTFGVRYYIALSGPALVVVPVVPWNHSIFELWCNGTIQFLSLSLLEPLDLKSLRRSWAIQIRVWSRLATLWCKLWFSQNFTYFGKVSQLVSKLTLAEKLFLKSWSFEEIKVYT